MDINGKMTADVVDVHRKSNLANDSTEATVDLVVGCTAEQLVQRFGETFAAWALAGMMVSAPQEGDAQAGEVIHYLDKRKKPGRYMVCSHHDIDLASDGKSAPARLLATQPEVRFADPVDGERKALVGIRLHFPVDRSDLRDLLWVAKTVVVDFAPKQATMTFTPRVVGGTATEGGASSGPEDEEEDEDATDEPEGVFEDDGAQASGG